MTITPTAQSSLLAGFVLWLVGWATFFHLDEVPYIGRWINQDRILKWINRDMKTKTCALLCTEVFNFAVHGVSNPAVVLFAIGGTVFNTIFIYLCIPVICWKRNRVSRNDLFQGAVTA